VAILRTIFAAFCLAASTLLPPSTLWANDGAALKEVPDFTRPDLKGDQITLSGYRGKLVLLNFWATWCAPCLVEIPKFVLWQRKYGAAGLQIVGVSMDDTATPVKRAYDKYHFNYPVVMGDAQLGERFGGVLGLPLSYLIGPQGRIVARYQGELNLKKLEAQIKSLLPRS
jgi:cytochrome c biogenesis protein CcmG, thiol:disulfide interchange protein DsbE